MMILREERRARHRTSKCLTCTPIRCHNHQRHSKSANLISPSRVVGTEQSLLPVLALDLIHGHSELWEELLHFLHIGPRQHHQLTSAWQRAHSSLEPTSLLVISPALLAHGIRLDDLAQMDARGHSIAQYARSDSRRSLASYEERNLAEILPGVTDLHHTSAKDAAFALPVARTAWVTPARC
jgi:hypothetical protein